MNACTAMTAAGKRCKAAPIPGRETCRWHDPSPEARAKHREESQRGGNTKAYGALAAGGALSEDVALDALDLLSAGGLTTYLAAALKALARLPFDVRVAHAISSLATAQRNAIETSTLETRLAALEASQPPALRRA